MEYITRDSSYNGDFNLLESFKERKLWTNTEKISFKVFM